MTLLILGIVVFFGVHSVRVFADAWRTRQIAARGERPWKGMYSLASAVGIVMLGWGYAQTRKAPVVLWSPPDWTYPITSALVLVSFVLFAAAYVRGNRIKAKIGHPMAAGVKTWAFAHLLSNGNLGDMLLFGAFFVWSIFAFAAARRRDRVAGTTYPVGPVASDVKTVVAGVVAWLIFGFWLHGWLIGVRPF
jgi:uncharacterized membrane protein